MTEAKITLSYDTSMLFSHANKFKKYFAFIYITITDHFH